MDHVLVGLFEVLRNSGLSDPRRFFESVYEVHLELDRTGEGADFSAFSTAFADRVNRDGFAGEGEYFVRYVEDNGGADVVRKLVDEGLDNVTSWYEQLSAEESGAATDADDGSYDEDAWHAFVVEYGASWNGEDDTWEAFKTWFLYHAEERGLRVPAAGFVEYADGESDRVAFFAQYGVTITVEADSADEDPDAWQAFLAEFGPAWNGDEENWAAFTPYFLHYAAERGVTGFAEGFVENAPEDNAERIGYFASYGVTITPEAAEDTTGEAADDTTVEETAEEAGEAAGDEIPAEVVAEAQQQFQDVAAQSDLVPPDLQDTLGEAFAQLVAEMPEAANLSPEQMRDLLATIPAEHL